MRESAGETGIAASGLKTLVVENASNGAPFAQGQSTYSPTKNVAVVAINAANGGILVTTTAIAGAGIVAYVPSSAGAPLVVGNVPSDRIAWSCSTAATTRLNKYREFECR